MQTVVFITMYTGMSLNMDIEKGIFVAPDTMPGWLQSFVSVNPVTILVTAVRGTMDGTASTSDVMWVLAICAAVVAVFGPVTMRLYRNKN